MKLQTFKQTEIGMIPEDWDVKKLGDIAEMSSGGTPLTSNNSYYGGQIPWAVIADMTRIKKYLYHTEKTITEQGLKGSSAKLFKKGTLLFAMYASIGKCAIAQVDVTCNQAILGINTKRVDTEFLYYYLAFNENKFLQMGQTGTQNNLNKEIVENLYIPYPQIQEQSAIASVLSDTDLLIESLDKLITKKKNVKQGAMQMLLTGKKRLPGFKGEWKKKLLGELFNFSGGHAASRDELSEKGFCYLHYGDIHKSNRTYVNVVNELINIPKLDIPLNKVSKVSLLNEGDVVFVDASEDDEGTSKHIVVCNIKDTVYISGLHTIVSKSKDESLDNLYKQYCFQTRDVKKQFYFYAVGTKVSGISKSNIAKIEIPVPQRVEQAAIAQILSDMDAEIEELEQKRDKYKQLKIGMMQQLLTGKIRLK